MQYSIPSTRALRQFIDAYAETDQEWKLFAQESKGYDLQVDIYDSSEDNTFQVAIFAKEDDSIISALASKSYDKDTCIVDTAFIRPMDWQLLTDRP